MTAASTSLLDEVERLAAETRGRSSAAASRATRSRPRVARDRVDPGPAPGSSRAARSPTRSASRSPRTSRRSGRRAAAPPGLRVVIVGQGRAIDGLPRADPARLRQGRHRRRVRRARGRGDRGARHRDGPRAQRRPDGRWRHRPDAASADDPASRGHRRDRPGQGHRRDPPAQRRAAAARLRRVPAGDGARRRRDPPALGDRDRGQGRGRHRSLRGGRHAGCVPAGQGGRDRHGLPFADPRPRRPRRAGRHRGRGGRPARAGHRGRCSSPAPSSSTSGSTSSMGASSATSTSRRPSRSPRRSRPVPGGVGPLTNAILLTHLIRAAERQAPRTAPARPSDPCPRHAPSCPEETDELPVRPRDRPLGPAAPDRRDRAATSASRDDELELYGPTKAKVTLEAITRLEAERPRGKYVVVTAITPTPLGEGKSTTTVGLAQGLNRIGTQGVGQHPPAVARAGLRHQGRGGRRRLQPGHPDGGLQPPPDRRRARDRRRAQPRRGVPRQQPPPQEPARHRPARDPLAARPRHQRPGPAPRRHRPRRARGRHPARDRVRHHGRLRGDGRPGARHRPARPARAARPDRPRDARPTARRSRPRTSAWPAR